MREAEFWIRMEEVLGEKYAHAWAELVVMSDLGGRCVTQALDAGIPCKKIWRAVWAQLELPESLR